MKRSALCFILLLTFFTAITACGKKTVLTRIAFVNFFGGEVFIINGAVKTPAKIGDKINEGLGIETGANSFVEIVLGENMIKLMEKTFVQVTQLTTNADKGEESDFFLKEGKTISRITKKLGKSDSYKVTTPTSVASVRGTDFVVGVEADKSYIACLNGKVAVRGTHVDDSQAVNVNGGQQVQVQAAAEPIDAESGKLAELAEPAPLVVQELSVTDKQQYEEILHNIAPIREDIKKQFEEELGKKPSESIDESAKEVSEPEVVPPKEEEKPVIVQKPKPAPPVKKEAEVTADNKVEPEPKQEEPQLDNESSEEKQSKGRRRGSTPGRL